MKTNLAIDTDSYKSSHFLQFPKDTKRCLYYAEARCDDRVTWYGLQMILRKHFMKVPSLVEIAEAEEFWKGHGLPFNAKGWMDILRLGYLPLSIIAIPEGTIVPGRTPLFNIVNTDERFPWLPGWCETLLMQVWYPTSAATISRMCKEVILKALDETGDPSLIPFKLHDFGMRGCTSHESAGIYGSAHLLNFMGTDTTVGIRAAKEYYACTEMPGFSIPASEHSTIISWGRGGETEAYKNMVEQFGQKGKIFACVSDSYDLSNAVRNIWGKELKEDIIKRECTLVVRPDSGDPSTIVVRTLDELSEAYGYTLNDKGYKVLPPCVRVIQGDGISSPQALKDILSAITYAGYSADNVAFGMGAGLAQRYDRDTFSFAMKACAVQRGKKWEGISKSPKDAVGKTSKAGLLHVKKNFEVVDALTNKDFDVKDAAMVPVFENGGIYGISFNDIRTRASQI